MSDLLKLAGLVVVLGFVMLGFEPGFQPVQPNSYGSGSSSWLGVLVLVMLVKFARDNR